MSPLLTALAVAGGYVVGSYVVGAVPYHGFLKKGDPSGDLEVSMVLLAPVGLPIMGWLALSAAADRLHRGG